MHMAMTGETYKDTKLWNNKFFPNRVKDDEDIVLIVREDIVTVFARALAHFLLFFIMLIIRAIFAGRADDFTMGIFDSVFFTFNIFLLTSFTLFFHNYYLSLQIITSERIIDIDQKGIFLREVNEMAMQNIQDITHKQNGFWGTIFNFGNVIIQTASSTAESDGTHEDKINGFVFNNVPAPSDIANLIGTLHQQSKADEMRQHAQFSAEAMSGIYKYPKFQEEDEQP
jgi:hypothetical protein